MAVQGVATQARHMTNVCFDISHGRAGWPTSHEENTTVQRHVHNERARTVHNNKYAVKRKIRCLLRKKNKQLNVFHIMRLSRIPDQTDLGFGSEHPSGKDLRKSQLQNDTANSG